MSYFYRPSLMVFRSADYLSGTDFRVTDHGRSPLEISTERIEKRERMANGTMRSKFIADKHTWSCSWEMLPSRSVVGTQNVVADGYSSANDLINFHKAVQGQFRLGLFADSDQSGSLVSWQTYGVYDVFFKEFSASIQKRGKDFDFWEISLSLEEA